MGFEDFESLFGEPKVEWSLAANKPTSVRPFLFRVHAMDSSRLRVQVTDFFSNSWEAVRSIQQLEDMRDNIGIGGSWSEFMEYLMTSIRSSDVKLVLEGQSKSDGPASARLIAQKSKGMPLISISLVRLVDAAASETMASLSLDLYRTYKSSQNLLVNGTEKKCETSRTSWKNLNVVKCFLETCVQEVSVNGRFGNSLKPESWTKVKETLKTNFNLEVSQKQMKNHYDYLKEKYHAWLPISHMTGNVYDPATNSIKWSPKEWDEYIKAHPKARLLRTSPLPFPALCTALFDGAAATEVHTSTHSSKSRKLGYLSPLSAIPLTAVNVDLLEIESTPVGSEDAGGMPSTPGSHSYLSKPTSHEERPKEERPKKKIKKRDSLDDEDMATMLKRIIQSNEGPSIEDCVAKLNRVGWSVTSLLYIAAQGIFCSGASYRQCWMLLDENKQLIENWVKTIGGPLGYVIGSSI